MNKFFTTTIVIVFALIFVCGCVKQETTNDVFKKTPIQETKAPVEKSTNPVSGPIQNSNYKSALSDATNAVTMLMTLMTAEDGIAVIDDGVIFEVTKESGVYDFVYRAGELEYSEEKIQHGTEITPDDPGWLQNVRVYMP